MEARAPHQSQVLTSVKAGLNCLIAFPPSSLKHVSKKEAKFIRASKAILNNCSGVIKNGGKARITMDLQFKELGPAIIFQLHGLPTDGSTKALVTLTRPTVCLPTHRPKHTP